PVTGRVRMDDRSRDRAAVANDGVGDLRGGVGHDVIARGQQARALGGLVADQRTDAQGAVTLLEKVQVLDLVDVDQVRRTGETKLEQRDQALAAGQHLTLITELIEELKRLLRGSRCVVLERRWQHGNPSWFRNNRRQCYHPSLGRHLCQRQSRPRAGAMSAPTKQPADAGPKYFPRESKSAYRLGHRRWRWRGRGQAGR